MGNPSGLSRATGDATDEVDAASSASLAHTPGDQAGHGGASVHRPALRWAVKSSFTRYVQVVAAGRCEAADGAEASADGAFTFPLLEAAQDDGGWWFSFGGSVRFSAHHGFLDVDLRGLELRSTADGTGLSIANAEGGRVTIATMEYAVPLNDPGAPRWQGLVPRLTEAGVGVFGDVYPVGTELAPLDAVAQSG
jgi:hypothetical protein